jgi:hypothetical protein
MLLVSREKLLPHLWRLSFSLTHSLLTGQSELATSVFCGYSPQKDLAKFGYKLNMKIKILNMVYVFLATLLEPCVKIWLFFFKFFLIMAIWKSQEALDFNTF